MSTKQNLAYQNVVGTGAGIVTKTIEIDHSAFTASTTDGIYTVVDMIPAYSIGIASIVETLETFNEAIASFKIGNSSGEDEWTTGAVETDDPTTIGFKSMNMYASSGTAALPGVVGTSAQDITVVLTHASAWSAITSGKIRVTLVYIATKPY